MRIGLRTVEAIEERGLSSRQFEQATGVSRRTVDSWLRDERYPNMRTLVDIARGLDVSLDWLSGLSDVKRKCGE